MLVDLAKSDLISLVKTTKPGSASELRCVAKCGIWSTSSNRWHWDDRVLGLLLDAELWDLYQICKEAQK